MILTLFSLMVCLLSKLGDSYVVREANLKDEKKLCELIASNSDIGYQTGIYTIKGADIDPKSFYDPMFLLSRNGSKVFICTQKYNQKAIGFLLLHTHFGYNVCRVEAIGVDQQHRRCGIATKMLDAACSFAKLHKCTTMYIHDANDNAKKCCLKYGFKFKKDDNIGVLTI